QAKTTDGKRCVTPVSVTFHSDEFDRSAWSYPLGVSDPDDRRVPLQSAAFAIDRDMRLHDGVAPLPAELPEAVSQHSVALSNEGEAQKEALDGEHEAPQMALIWASHAAQYGWPHRGENARSDESYCQKDEDAKSPSRLVRFVLNGWKVSRQMRPAEKPLCVHHDTFRVADLRGPSEADDKMLTTLIDGRIVMYGSALLAAGDYVNSPLEGDIPGVYLHAMALDNLITYGSNWKRLQSIEWAAPFPDQAFFITVLVLTILTGICAARLFKVEALDEKKTGLHHGVKWLVTATCKLSMKWTILLLTAAAVVYVAHTWRNLGPIGYVELTMAVLTGHFLHLSHTLYECGHRIGHQFQMRSRMRCPAVHVGTCIGLNRKSKNGAK
ncbi:MAG: CHASE2 domain-containing protein, partial [Janthinobacterium lividum]